MTAAASPAQPLHYACYTGAQLPTPPSSARKSATPKRTPRYGTLEQLAAARKKQMAPDSSYALGKPAHDLSHRDLFLARKFDRDNKGFLTDTEQVDAKEALAGGLGKDHYSDYFSYKPTTRFQKTLEQTLPTAPASYEDTFNRCFTDFDERACNLAEHVPPSTMTRTKLFRQRTLSEQQALAKKIEAGWTNAIDRLRPKSNPNSQRRLRQGYTAQPRHGTKTEMLDKRAENKRPKSGYRLNGTDGVRCPSRPPLAPAPPPLTPAKQDESRLSD